MPGAFSTAVRRGQQRLGAEALLLLGAFAVPAPGRSGASAAHLFHLPCLCLFRDLTGLPCPACGITRSVICAAHGRVLDAVYFHPMGPIVFAALIVGAWMRWTGKTVPLSGRAMNGIWAAGIAALLLIWGGRLLHLLPWPPNN